jgi:hypothetical protein
MDSVDSNGNAEHVVRAAVYVNLDEPGNRVAQVGRAWFGQWLALAAPLADMVSRGGDGAMLHMADEESPIAAASYSPEGWRALLDRLDEDPHSLAIDLDSDGPDERLLFRSLNMRRKVWVTPTRRYAALTFEGRVGSWVDMAAASDRIFAAFLAACGESSPVYGEASLDGEPVGPWTMLDHALGRSWEESLDEGRDRLRGHEWATVCPAELVSAMAGAESLRGSGAFVAVSELPSGAVVARTVDAATDHNRETARRTAEALAKILPG